MFGVQVFQSNSELLKRYKFCKVLQFVSDSSGVVVSFVGLLAGSYEQPINGLVIFPVFFFPSLHVGAVAVSLPLLI